MKQHPNYGALTKLDASDWVLAQKTMTQSKTYTIVNRESTTSLLGKVVYKVYRWLKLRNQA